MTRLERLQRINIILIGRINFLSVDKKENKLQIEVFENRKFVIQKAMFRK